MFQTNVTSLFIFSSVMTITSNLMLLCVHWEWGTSHIVPTLSAPCWSIQKILYRKHMNFWSQWKKKSLTNYSMVSLRQDRNLCLKCVLSGILLFYYNQAMYILPWKGVLCFHFYVLCVGRVYWNTCILKIFI